MRIVWGFCVVDKATGVRWGGLYESEKGAIASFNKTRGGVPMHPVLGRRVYWHEQDSFVIAPLVIPEDFKWA